MSDAQNPPAPRPQSPATDPQVEPPADAMETFARAARRGAPDAPETEIWRGAFSPKAMLGSWLAAAGATIASVVVGLVMSLSASAWGGLLLAVLAFWGVLGLVYAYRRLSVQYRLTTQRLVHESGVLWRTVDRIELIDIDDVTYRQGPVERALGVGTLLIASTDRTSPELTLPGIDGVRNVADLIDGARRKERRLRSLHLETN